MKNSNKLLLSAMAITIATPAIIVPMDGPAYEVEAATYKKVFKDVTKKNSNYDIIHEMAAEGIIKGYSDNTFRGGNSITRYQVASLVYRYIGDGLPVQNEQATIPSDVSPRSEHYQATVTLIKAGLLSPSEDGKLYPNKPITRAEMAKILVKAFDVKIKADYDFADTIEGDAETRDYVRALYSNGITTGYLEDATFRPEKSLTRQQFAVFMHRSINVDPEFVAPPIEIPEKEDEIVEQKPSVPVEPSQPQPNGDLIINPPSPDYDRYALDNKPTPLSELNNLPIDPSKVDTENAIYNQSLSGLGLVQHNENTNKIYEDYRRVILAGSYATLETSRLTHEGFIKNHLKYFNNSYEQLVQAFYYAYSTGAVYKGEGIVIKFFYSQSKDKGGAFSIARNDKYGR